MSQRHGPGLRFLLACGATVELASADGRRELGIGDFVLGPLWTAREPDEVIVAIHVPPAARGSGRAYEKIAFFERPAASVGVALRVAGGAITEATVTVGSLTEVPQVVASVGDGFLGADATEGALDAPVRAASDAFGALDVIADHNGSEEYKRHLAGVLLGRAARGALQEALAHA